MTGQPKDGDGLAAGGGGALGDQDAERLCGIGHIAKFALSNA
jgi:hypothetical protein